MVQLGFLVIWAGSLITWLIVNLLIYRQLQTVSALRTDVVGWFIAQVVVGAFFFIVALVSIYYLGPIFSTSSLVRTNGVF